MLGMNGGLIGNRRTTNVSQASGIWTPNEQVLSVRALAWPGVGDPDYSSVTTLLHMDGSNDSTVFINNAPAPLTTTANGNAKISTAQSKFGGASAVFDGSGDYLSITSHPALGTGAFTIEFWFYLNTVSGRRGFFETRSPGGYSFTPRYPVIEINGTSLIFTVTNAIVLTAPTIIVINNWYHCALVKSGSTTTMYLNGVSQGTYNDTNNYATTAFTAIGATLSGSALSYYLNGYVDEFRITKGVARYTANFTPQTAPFPNV